MKLFIKIPGQPREIMLDIDPKGVTQEDMENLLALWPHCFLKNSFEFSFGDVPIVYGRPLAEFGIECDGALLVATEPATRHAAAGGGGSPAIGGGGAAVAAKNNSVKPMFDLTNYANMTRVGAWAEKSYADGPVKQFRIARVGLNMLCDCRECGTVGVYVQMGLVRNVDVVLYQFGTEFRCPVPGCGKTPIFRELIFAAPADRDVRFTVHGHYMENGVPRIIGEKDARPAICKKNKWCRIDEAVVGGTSQWIRLVVNAEVVLSESPEEGAGNSSSDF
jgi:hypothetical protein